MTCRYGPRPDRPPDNPHASDDEFTSTSLASWTFIEEDGTVTHDSNTTVESCLYVSNADGDFYMYKAMPTIPFRVILKVAAYANPMGTGVRTDVGLMLAGTTPDSGFLHGALDIAEDNYFALGGGLWTDTDNFSTNIGDAQFAPGGTLSSSPTRAQGFAYMRPHWIRFDVNSQSDVDGYFSFDGLLYTPWLTSYNPSFTIATVGIDCHSGTAYTQAAFDYIRFTAL